MTSTEPHLFLSHSRPLLPAASEDPRTVLLLLHTIHILAAESNVILENDLLLPLILLPANVSLAWAPATVPAPCDKQYSPMTCARSLFPLPLTRTHTHTRR